MMSKTHSLNFLMSAKEVASMIGAHPATVERARKAGKLSAFYLGRRMVRYSLEDVKKWLEGTRYQAAA
jgi:excisionase family DNA binding protein